MDQGNVSGCTGCQNLSNPTQQWTREMCLDVQDVITCLIRHSNGPGKCVWVMKLTNMYIEKTHLYQHDMLTLLTHFSSPPEIVGFVLLSVQFSV